MNFAAVASLGEIARNGSLLFETQEEKCNLVNTLAKKLQTSKETNKLKEKVAATLGYFCIHDDNSVEFSVKTDEKSLDKFGQYVMDKLLNSSQAKQVELHMAMGEALANCALGEKSTASSSSWLISQEQDTDNGSNKEFDETNIKWLMNELLNNYMQSPNPHLRQASCFWLLIFVKKCSKVSKMVEKNLPQIQEAFIQRLGENDEVTQEVASKGMH